MHFEAKSEGNFLGHSHFLKEKKSGLYLISILIYNEPINSNYF